MLKHGYACPYRGRGVIGDEPWCTCVNRLNRDNLAAKTERALKRSAQGKGASE